MQLGTSRFRVIIAPECSGLEGISLFLLFGCLWLILFRRELRFPQALLLLPLGATVLFILNSVRIATLLLIGHFGAKQVAARGFHSQAGWIAFNAVSFGLCVIARRLPWFTNYRRPSVAASQGKATEVYLMPALSLLAAGMIAQAATGAFQWLYPLRLVVLSAIVWRYRREYRRIDWRLSSGRWSRWIGPAAGILVFAIWVGLDRMGTGAPAPMPPPLIHTLPAIRDAWISLRVLSAVVAAPFAEELAFRGFLICRVQAADFESLPATSYSWRGILISSAVFGALHAGRWPAAILAGVIYGVAFVRRGRIGDVIAAHATTNVLLAGAVLIFGSWQYW